MHHAAARRSRHAPRRLLARRRALGDLDAPGQLELFVEEAPLPAPPSTREASDGETSTDEIRRRHRRTNAAREMAYAALPREHVQHELAPAERICPVTRKTRVAIGEKESEALECRRAKLVVLVHHRPVYGLSDEDRKERTIEPLVAPAPARPIENGLAGAGPPPSSHL